jgi:diguanylate cyclase (GGDEF)-like protein
MARRAIGVLERTVSPLGGVTAVLYAIAAAGLLLSAIFHTEGKNPRWVLASLGAVAVAFVAVALLRGKAFTRLEAEIMLAVQLAGIVGLTIGSGLDIGALSNGTALPLIGIYTGWFLSRRASMLFYVGLVGWCAALAARSDSLLASVALTIAAESMVASEVVRLLRRRISRLMRTDSLTGVLNRHGLERTGRRQVARCERRRQPLSVALIDLDDLRTVNNTEGHSAGDELLVRASRQWHEELTDGEAVGRIGGDEFVIVLPGRTSAEAEERLTDLRRRAPARWTAGVAEARSGESFEQVVERADRVMYNRKGGAETARPDGGPS